MIVTPNGRLGDTACCISASFDGLPCHLSLLKRCIAQPARGFSGIVQPGAVGAVGLHVICQQRRDGERLTPPQPARGQRPAPGRQDAGGTRPPRPQRRRIHSRLRAAEPPPNPPSRTPPTPTGEQGWNACSTPPLRGRLKPRLRACRHQVRLRGLPPPRRARMPMSGGWGTREGGFGGRRPLRRECIRQRATLSGILLRAAYVAERGVGEYEDQYTA